MRFLLDAHLPPSLTDWLRERGFETLHVREIGLQSASDRMIWDEAARTFAIVVTKDTDFSSRKSVSRAPVPVVILLRVGNGSTSDLLQCWNAAWIYLQARIIRGEHLLFVDRA